MNAADVWTILRWVHYLSLSFWIGGIFIVSAVVAPSVHQSIISRAMAGEIVGKVLAKLNRIEIVCFSVLLGTLSSALHFAGYNRETLGLFGAVAVMGVLTFFYAFQLTPKMRELREGTPGFYDLNPEHPVKKEFGKLHRFYVRLMSMNFLLGLGVFYVSLSVLH